MNVVDYFGSGVGVFGDFGLKVDEIIVIVEMFVVGYDYGMDCVVLFGFV